MLREQFGVEKGDRVAILAHNGIAFVDLLYGLAKIGAVFTPLNWRLTSRELSYIIENAQPKVLICAPEFTGVLADIQAVLETLVPKEVEVHSQAGMWYTMRILPYRTLENRIDGVVITFSNITEAKRLEAQLRQAKSGTK